MSQPREIRVQEGTTALLPCSFNASRGTVVIGSVTWYQDQVALGMQVSNMTPEFRGHVASFAVVPQFIRDHKAELIIQDIQSRDTGIYVCIMVEVPGLGVGTGNGTRLLVGKGEVVGDPKMQCSWELRAVPSSEFPSSFCRIDSSASFQLRASSPHKSPPLGWILCLQFSLYGHGQYPLLSGQM